MGKAGRKRKHDPRGPLQRVIDAHQEQDDRNFDATPERLAMEPGAPLEDVKSDGFGQRIGRARRFTATHLDRFKNNDRLTIRQWMAGDWYRQTHARCGFGLSVIAAYGERLGGGEPSYGMARTEAQAIARDDYRAARLQWPGDMVGFMERMLINDEMPSHRGRANMRTLKQLGDALDVLATWLERRRTKSAQTKNISLAECGNIRVCG